MNNLIYRILFPDGKSYVGKTKDINKRMGYYKKYKCKTQPKLYDALIKYTFENVIVDVIEENIPEEYLNEREIYHIKNIGSFVDGYNCTPGGDGILMTEEIRNKISKTLKSKNIKRSEDHIKILKDMSNKSPEFLKYMGENKVFSEETRRKISEKNKGRFKGIPLRDDVKLKISKSLRENADNKFYKFISPDGNVYVTNKFREFIEQHSLHLRSVHRVITGERPHHKGWIIRKVS